MDQNSSPATSRTHYKAYEPGPFLSSQRSDVEILFGGLNWRAERVIEAVFENLGYRSRRLPAPDRDDLRLGRELADIGQCCPTTYLTGNLARFLRSEQDKAGPAVSDRYVYLTAGACGACRFGQYHQSYELALRSLGLEAFRIYLMEQTRFCQGETPGGGLRMDAPFTFGLIWALLCTDVLQGLEYRTRPYELELGQTDRVVKEGVELLCEAFRRRPAVRGHWRNMAWHVATDYFRKPLREICRRFGAIAVDRLRPKPIVMITGEFYLQTVEGEPNYNLHRWLEQEGAEVHPAPVAIWLDYLIRVHRQAAEDHFGIDRTARWHAFQARSLDLLLRVSYGRLRRACGSLPHAIPSQEELRRLAAPYFHYRLSGGEGDMLIGKALWAHLRKQAHMICELSPYGCLPNTMSVGAMAGVTRNHPDLLYAPIEVNGDNEVHALSRCQMVLTEARQRAFEEFERSRRALSDAELHRRLEQHPRLRLANRPVPRRGKIGTAANLAAVLAR